MKGIRRCVKVSTDKRQVQANRGPDPMDAAKLATRTARDVDVYGTVIAVNVK